MNHMCTRIFWCADNEARVVAEELCDDKNTLDLMRRFLSEEIGPDQMVAEFQILSETTWARIYGAKERRDIHATRD